MSTTKSKITNKKLWDLLMKMEAKIESIDKRLTNLDIEINIRFDEHDQRFNRVDKKMIQMDERIIEVQDAFVGLNKNFDYEFASLSKRLSNFETN